MYGRADGIPNSIRFVGGDLYYSRAACFHWRESSLNPTDWKHVNYFSPPGALVGCDNAGVVEEFGKDVRKPFTKGEQFKAKRLD